ncbi:GAF and ANTAR domain-containing protein [Rhodococcus sp. SGAir0479]|uniref:GAF and ANTAR domain-containing protein n=1 Tax=Rhodococcus sp. SGAir0479 TaxID=2567884 RepID=UPI0010CD1901|nr:GAF and ANTAR domain-containing protein [Rhodococcus sp. SGAir0479]QCQ89930.1 ANTAR domain-containing protein [Rhodococcus sp. SGAir0479]
MVHTDPRTDGRAPGADEVVAIAEVSDLPPNRLASILVSLGESITDEDDLVNLLDRVTEVAHEVIDGADCTGVTIDFGGRTYTASYTDGRTLRVDHEQYAAGEGPCLHASRTRETVLVDLDEATDRWPAFTEAARAEGICSFLAAPLFVADRTLGALNLYGRARAAFDEVDADVLELLTSTVSRAIGEFARFKSARDAADALQRALETRAPIEQAKGMLMALHRIDAQQAFEVLRKQSQTTNTRLRDVAADLVEKLSATDGSGAGEAVS